MSDREASREERTWWARIALPAAGFTVFGLVALVAWLMLRSEGDRLEPIRTVNQAGDTIVYSGRVRDAVARARIVEAFNSTAARAEDAAGDAGDSARYAAAARDARQAAVDELARLYADPADPEAVVAAMNLATIDFAAGAADLPPDAAGFIQGAAEVIQRVPDGTVIVVVGYADDAEESDTELAGRRARVVVDALVEAGADTDRLRAEARAGEPPDIVEQAADDGTTGQVAFELAEPAEVPAVDEADARQSDSLPNADPETPLTSDTSSDESSPASPD